MLLLKSKNECRSAVGLAFMSQAATQEVTRQKKKKTTLINCLWSVHIEERGKRGMFYVCVFVY